MKTRQTRIVGPKNRGGLTGTASARAGAANWARIRKGLCEWVAVFGMLATMSTLTAAIIVVIVNTVAGTM